MITEKYLKQELRALHVNRLTRYGNTAYQRISNDWRFENVPTELKVLWYGQDDVSFVTLAIGYDSDIDFMSHDELVRWIDNERSLIARLENVFSNLSKKKGGDV